MPATPREHTRTYFLGKLAVELERHGLTMTLRADPPALRISHPDTALLAETVDCVPLPDGWFYRLVVGRSGGGGRRSRAGRHPDRARTRPPLIRTRWWR